MKRRLCITALIAILARTGALAAAEGAPIVRIRRRSTRPSRACTSAPLAAPSEEIARFEAAAAGAEPSAATSKGRRNCPSTSPTIAPT